MCYTFLKRFESRQTVENQPRSGRRRNTSSRDDRHIVRYTKANRRQTLQDITNSVNNNLSLSVSSRTVRRRLRQFGYRRRKIAKTLTISRPNCLRRLNWCKSRLSCLTLNKWPSVIFNCSPVYTGEQVLLSVLCVCLSVFKISQEPVDGSRPNLVGRWKG